MDKKFQVGDIVWASAKRDIFWPAKVFKITHGFEGDQTNLRKTKKTASGGSVWVDFYGEETQEQIKQEKNIRSWNCAEEQEFIKNGREMKDNRKKLIFNRGLKKACYEAGSGYQRNEEPRSGEGDLRRSPRKSIVLAHGNQRDDQPGADEGILRRSPRKSFSSPLVKQLKENINQTLLKTKLGSDKDGNGRNSFKKKLFAINNHSDRKLIIKHTGKRKMNRCREEEMPVERETKDTIEGSGISKKLSETINDMKSVDAEELSTQSSKVGSDTNADIERKTRSNTAKKVSKSSRSVTINHKGKKNAVTKGRRRKSPTQSEEKKQKKTRTCTTVSRSNVRNKNKAGKISNVRNITGKTKSQVVHTGKRRMLKKRLGAVVGRTLVREKGKVGKVSKKSKSMKETRKKFRTEKNKEVKSDSDVNATKSKVRDIGMPEKVSKRKANSKFNNVKTTQPRNSFPNVESNEKDLGNKIDSEKNLNNKGKHFSSTRSRRNSLSLIQKGENTKVCGSQSDPELHSIREDSTGERSECSKNGQTTFKSQKQKERTKSKRSLDNGECSSMKGRKRKVCEEVGNDLNRKTKMKMDGTSLDNLPLNGLKESFSPVLERQNEEAQGDQTDSKLHLVREGKKKHEISTTDIPEQVSKKEQLKKVENISVSAAPNNIEGSKRKAREQSGHASKRKYQKKKDRNDQEVTSVSEVTAVVPENSYSNSASDDGDTSDDELPEAFTTSHTSLQGCFSVGELVWAKYRRSPFWPSQVKKISAAKRKLDRKIYIKFLCDGTKKLFRVPPKNLLHFACEPARREELMNEGNKIKVENQQRMFQDAVVFAEQLILRKGLGKETEELDEEYEIVESAEEKEEQKMEEDSGETVGVNGEGESNIRKSTRKRRHTSKYNDVLNYIKQSRAHLKLIYEGKRSSERHRIFKSGTVKEKNNLKRISGFGPVEDLQECDRIMEYLVDYYKEMDNIVQYSEVHYVSEVWLPEALIFATQQIEHVDRERAEEIYRRGTKPTMTNHEAEELVKTLWRKRRLTDEEREKVMERAEIRLSRDAGPLL